MTTLSSSPQDSNSSIHGYTRQGRRRSRAPAIAIGSADAEYATLDTDSLRSIGSEPSSPDSTYFHKSQIDMKALIGDAVGNMSISPSSRDVVLAARRGLYIIDLESPLKIPRFLPQGGTWDVADVQWNPHPHRAEYVVSTSSEKLLIWNLSMGGKTSIEHVLLAHYRAITDINWHTTEPDTVVSTGIDAWIWAWDLRTPRKPIFGLSAFNDGGTQVKCNRSDPNILASSHSNQVLVWDRRNGALPISRVNAHSAKIYGIDWSHSNPSEIVTCSLDRTIKVWDTKDSLSANSNEVNPSTTMHTSYPVWRARNLPFGRGILSLPQRGETALEMYSMEGDGLLVDTFEGHTDVVKEFVWRKDADEFQLITWSKDGTLRFWPVDPDTMKKVGHSPQGRSKTRPSMETMRDVSFRKPPPNQDYKPTFSAPVGSRAILAEVRAHIPAKVQNTVVPYPPTTSSSDLTSSVATAIPMHITKTPIARGGTMSRGTMTGRSHVSTRMDPLAWLQMVKVDESRGRSSSGPESADVSRVRDEEDILGGRKRRSESREERREAEDGLGGQSLPHEITSVVTKLQTQYSAKIKLEKADFSKKRSCTFGLYGPWGETSTVFMRVTFVFPKGYPHREYPDGIPSVDLERNPLISQKDRFFVLRKLRTIRERRRPCLEACLRFLLFAEEGDKAGNALELADSSSEEEDGEESKAKEITVSLLRNTKNLAEPRTSQGTFGPNGELVCFFQAAPRFVRHILPSGATLSPGEQDPNTSTSQDAQDSEELTGTEDHQPPALLSDALRFLHASALDRNMKSFEDRQAAAGGDRFFQFTTNFLTLTNVHQRHSAQRLRSSSPAQSGSHSHQDAQAKEYSYVASRRSTVFMVSTLGTTGGDKIAGEGYLFQESTIAILCDRNAAVARAIHRYDHERVFRTLGALFLKVESEDSETKKPSQQALLKRATDSILNHYRTQKDIQMLAMVSVVILQAFGYLDKASTSTPLHTNMSQVLTASSLTATPGRVGNDYFSLTRRSRRASTATGRPSPGSPQWPPRLSPSPGATASTGSSGSSRGSWGSIFNPGTVRQFVAGMGETLKDGLATPMEEDPGTQGPIAVPNTSNSGAEAIARARRSLGSSISRSWNEKTTIPAPLLRSTGSGTLARRRHDTVVRPDQKPLNRKKVVYFSSQEVSEAAPALRPADIDLLVQPILVYADMLFRWELNHKRLELLKVVRRQEPETKQYEIGALLNCARCSIPIDRNHAVCVSCSHPIQKPSCTICRLPVRGLSHSCTQCLHVSHMSCWRRLNATICPSGCGCFCSGLADAFLDAEYDLASPTVMR